MMTMDEEQTVLNDTEPDFVPKPDNYMAFAIVTTICCCLPTGIYAIIRASKVNEYYAMKQYVQAQAAANDAKTWSIIGLILGIVINIIVFTLHGIALYGQYL